MPLPPGGALCASSLWKNPEGIFQTTQKIELEDIPERRDAVLHPDFLTLLVSPSAVGNWHLVDGNAEFGNFRRHFNLEAESGAGDRHVADNVATKCFVAGFDIGHIDVRA